jgi:eukaryotic-like serine/threonine-protein kinase
MRESGSPTDRDSSERNQRQIRIAESFEAACVAKQNPRIGDYLNAVTEAEAPDMRRRLENIQREYQRSSPDATSPWELPKTGAGRASSAASTEADLGGGDNTRQLPRGAEATLTGPALQEPTRHRLAPGTTMGDYEIISFVGAGGMGEVYKARSRKKNLDQIVALKLIRSDLLGEGGSETLAKRFENEIRANSRIDHENTVRVIDAGESEGRLFYAMSFVDGEGLDKRLKRSRLSGKQAAELLIPVCRAVQSAHSMGIVHRDLKPSNVVIDRSNKPYVTDFGLAKFHEASGSLTAAGQVLGTIEYMSPEQARDSSEVGPASDIYSLGATLYAMLIGRPPFPADSSARTRRQANPDTRGERPDVAPAEVMRQVINDLPKPLRKSDPTIPADLETICLKCLEKDPARRYKTAQELGDRLTRVVENRPIPERPPSLLGRTNRWARRNPVIASLLTLVLVVATVGFVATVLQLRQTKLALSQLERRGYFDHIALASEALSANKVKLANDLLNECPEKLRDWEWAYLSRLASAKPVMSLIQPDRFPKQPAELYGVAFSPDGNRFLTGGRRAPVRLWEVDGAHPPIELPGLPKHVDVSEVAWSEGGNGLNRMAASCDDGSVHVWDESGGKPTAHRVCRGHKKPVSHVAFDSVGSQLATAGSDGRILVFDAATGTLSRTIQADGPPLEAIAFGRRDRMLASGGEDGVIRLWNAADGALIRVLSPFDDIVVTVAFSPDGRYFAAGDLGGMIRLWLLDDLENPMNLAGHFDGINAIAFSPNSKRLASASADRSVKIWDVAEGRDLLTLPARSDDESLSPSGLPGHTDQVEALSFRPGDGLQLLSAGADGRLILWDATVWNRSPPKPPHDFQGHRMQIVAIAVSADGAQIASAGYDPVIFVWDSVKRGAPSRLSGHREKVNGLAFDPRGGRLASASRDGVRIWDLGANSQIGNHDSNGARATAVAFSPDGAQLVWGTDDHTVMLWGGAANVAPIRIGRHGDEIYAAAFHPEGRLVASAGAEGVIRIWDVVERAHQYDLPMQGQRGHTRQIDGLAFSPDGSLLASASHDWTVRIWDLATRESRKPLTGHDSRVWRVAFSSDGRLLASAGSDGSVRVWDVAQGRQTAILLGHTARVYSVAFDPLGRYLASAGADRLVKIWRPEVWNFPSTTDALNSGADRSLPALR